MFRPSARQNTIVAVQRRLIRSLSFCESLVFEERKSAWCDWEGWVCMIDVALPHRYNCKCSMCARFLKPFAYLHVLLGSVRLLHVPMIPLGLKPQWHLAACALPMGGATRHTCLECKHAWDGLIERIDCIDLLNEQIQWSARGV